MPKKNGGDEDEVEGVRRDETRRWPRRGKYDEAGRAEHKKKVTAMREYLRRDLKEFLQALGVTESDPEYEQFVAIWREFHES